MQEEKNNRWPRYAVITLIIVVVLFLVLILFLYLVKSPLIFRSGAFSPATTITEMGSGSLSLDNSYVFASPLRAKTNGEKIRITVFILSDRGVGMSGKTVSIGGGKLLQVVSIQPVTDAQGRATFDVASESSPGVYIIQAATDGVNLKQTATISFD